MDKTLTEHLWRLFAGLLSAVIAANLAIPGAIAFAGPSDSSTAVNKQANDARYTVLVLDVAGPETFFFSKHLGGGAILRIGGPDSYTADSSIEYVKSAASKFVDDSKYALNDNHIAVVAYAADATTVCGFTDDRVKLKQAINSLQEIDGGDDGADRNIAAALDMAYELLAGVPDGQATKNVLLCTTGLTDSGEYSYDGRYDESVIGSTWQNMVTEIKLYAYSNIAIESASRIKETGATVYVMGVFEPVESGMPGEGQDVASLLRIVARDLASSEDTFSEIEDPEEIEFVFGELQTELAGSALKRIYNDASYSADHALIEQDPNSGMRGLYYEEMLWGPDLFGTPATRMHLQSITSTDSPNYNLAMLCGSLSATAYNERYLRYAYNILGIDDDDIFLYSYPSSNLNRGNALIKGRKFASDDLFAFSIASREMSFGDVGIGDLVIINLSGTHTLTEAMKDKLAKADNDFYGYTAYDLICDYRDEVFAGLEDFHSEHEELGARPLKFLITGHSLAGAGANLVAAQLNMESGGAAWYSRNVTPDDVYAYTFGAIDSISKGQWNYEPDSALAEYEKGASAESLGVSNGLSSSEESERVDVSLPVTKGFENIVNIYNYLDTFGPYWRGVDRLGITAPAGNSMYGKFGVFFTFSEGDMSGIVDSGSVWPTHEIAGYLAALRLGWLNPDAATDYVRISIRCPVDVSIYKDDELVLSVIDEGVTVNDAGIKAVVEDRAKAMVLPKDDSFGIEIVATDSGTMRYDVSDLDPASQAGITYDNVNLEAGKQMSSDLDAGMRADSVELFVLDADGERIACVETSGLEAEIETQMPDVIGGQSAPGFRGVFLVCGGLLAVCALALIVIQKRRKRP